LHLYETLGWFRKKEYIKIHFAESWNELHHLLIMEELGGNKEFVDRFVAQHIAFFYYWIVVFLYILSPSIAYDLNEEVENHAFETYNEFILKNGDELKLQPAPQVAIDYYQEGFLFSFFILIISFTVFICFFYCLFYIFITLKNY
jgi:ubiquinol oxidase